MVPIGDGTATASNHDGSVIVGLVEVIGPLESHYQAFRWTNAGGAMWLGALPGHVNSFAGGVSADGSVVVGTSSDELGTSVSAFLWTPALGMVDLNTHLPGLGISLFGHLREARAVSANGRTITGFGFPGSLTGPPEAWVARLPGFCFPNCDDSTTIPVLNILDFVCFLQRFAAGDTYANCDGSSTAPILNLGDFICFQRAFAAGCP
jgi:probable HAF family extracellular repeat protein